MDSKREWAAIQGQAGVQWLESAETLLEATPRTGAEYDTLLASSCDVVTNVPFWTLYRPGLVNINGWERDDALAGIRLVRAELITKPAPLSGGGGWESYFAVDKIARARVLEVLDPVTWATGLAPSHGGQFEPPMARARRIDHRELTLLESNLEGDVGNDLLFVRIAQPRWTLVCEYLWGGPDDEDRFYAGRRELSEREHARCAEIKVG